MSLAPVAPDKSVLPEKAGAETPTALLGAKSMCTTETVDDNSDARCPTCGEQFTNRNSMKSHHKQVHDESIAGERSECDHCGEAFRASTACPGTYCSNECQAAGQRERVKLTCAQCGETFQRKPNKVGDGRTYCSTECRDEYMRTRNREDHPRWLGERDVKVCEHCDTEFRAVPGVRGRDRFCSLDCSRAYDRANASHSTLSTAVRSRLPNGWGRWRSDVRSGECEMCGVESDGQAHDLHHIVPILAGGVNERELLIELCRQCHETVEAYTRDLPGMESVLTEEVAE